MRYVLTVDGVPVGRAHLPPGNRVAGHVDPLPGFFEFGLAAVAYRAGEALRLSQGPAARPSPRQRRLRLAAREERVAWEPRLGLLDDRGAQVPVGRISVLAFSLAKPFVIIDFRTLPALVGARLRPPVSRGLETVLPAA